MEQELVNTVLEKEFNELSSNERISLNDYCSSEEEFEQLGSKGADPEFPFQAEHDADATICPKCGSECWDNRKNREPGAQRECTSRKAAKSVHRFECDDCSTHTH